MTPTKTRREEPAGLRVPPHSTEAEQSVLGGLMLDSAAFDRVGDMLTPADFYGHHNRTIFEAVAGLVVSGKPADVITVHEALGHRAEEAGGLAYLNALCASVPGASNIRRYAEIVRERAVRRLIIAAADEAATLAWGDKSVSDCLDHVSGLFGRIDRGMQRQEPMALRELVVSAIDRYSALADGTAEAAISTGIDPLDKLLNGGLKGGKVYGIAARPSVGKSSAARTIAIAAAKADKRVLLLSQEMPTDEIADCVIAELGRIDGSRLQTGGLSDDDWGRLTEAAETASRLPVFVDDQGGLTIADVRRKARGIKRLDVLVLDYLQLCSSTLKGATTNDQIAEISRGLKALALEMRIPVVVLSQLNRDVEKRVDKEPKLSDLRDSGAIEQDLDVAILLWTAAEADHDTSRLVGWRVAKHRGGAKGVFAMRFEPAVNRWIESHETLRRSTGGRGDL